MKILCLTKRRYTSKDLIRDKYGRCYELPLFLSEMGHKVELICHSYRIDVEETIKPNRNLKISSWNLGLNPAYGLLKHYKRLNQIILQFKPNIIIAGSDCFQVILGSRLARHNSLPFIADIYDNFASFKASLFPFILPLFYRELANAVAITVVSEKLRELMVKKIKRDERIFLLENAATNSFLRENNKLVSRVKLNFNPDEIYIGTAGDLRLDRGISLLMDTFMEMYNENNKLNLVLAGSKDKNLVIPAEQNVHYLGQLQHEQIPILLSALDIGVICLKDTEFGRYCFPQKYYEMLACKLPLVASNVGEMTRLLENKPDLLFESDNKQDLKRAIQYQLDNKVVIDSDVPSWGQQAEKLNDIIESTVANNQQ